MKACLILFAHCIFCGVMEGQGVPTSDVCWRTQQQTNIFGAKKGELSPCLVWQKLPALLNLIRIDAFHELHEYESIQGQLDPVVPEIVSDK